MRATIVGAGRAGLGVAVHLVTTGHEVLVLDHDPAVTSRARDQHGLVAMTGDATDASVLREAEVHRSDVLVAMLRRDADNLAVALLARNVGVSRVMVRMRDREYRAVYLAAGVSRILSEVDVFVGAFGTAIEHDGVRHAMMLGTGESTAFELEIPPLAAVAGIAVRDAAAEPDFPASCVLAGLAPPGGGAVHAPRGSSVMEVGSRLLLVTSSSEIGAAIDFFTRPTQRRTNR